MNTQDIYNFITVCESGSFSKAAQKLFITPQGLSKSIKGLESELGIIMLHRNNKGISLTEQGRVFPEAARELYAQLNKLEHMLPVRGQDLCIYPIDVKRHCALVTKKHISPITREFLKYLGCGEAVCQ